MNYQSRILQQSLKETLHRGKSIILLGARQTGKTTLLKNSCQPDLSYNLSSPKLRRIFEVDPDRLASEIEALDVGTHVPLVIIDEVQKVPELIDVAQYLIDDNKAQFILTGSSARKLKKREAGDINLLPGRVIKLQLDALTISEMPKPLESIENLLLYGQLPEISLESNLAYREDSLKSYVDIYLEEEIRQEALVRNLAAFSTFLELAAIEAGNAINFSKLSQTIGINIHLIQEYFQILEDCLIVDKIMPLTDSKSRRRLHKAPKYLFFDLGVRRVCAKEGNQLSQKAMSHLFEQFIGIEINRHIRLTNSRYKLCHWQDYAGPKVDFVIDKHESYIPIEVKWTENPTKSDARHLVKFLSDYDTVETAYVVCRTERRRVLSERIIALPWQELPSILA